MAGGECEFGISKTVFRFGVVGYGSIKGDRSLIWMGEGAVDNAGVAEASA